MLATSIFLFVGLGALVAWQITGRVECVRVFFRGPGALYLVFLAALEFSLARMVVRQFAEGEPLQPAWFLIMLSAGCHTVSALCVQVLSVNSALNPLSYGGEPVGGNATNIYRFGILVGGPLQMLLLAAGLGWLLRMCRRTGFVGRFKPRDWLLLFIAGVEVWFESSFLIRAFRGGSVPGAYEIIMALNGPLLVLLLIEANLVRSYMSVLGRGLIAKCWGAFAAAIFLTTVGNLGLWMNMNGYLPPELAGITWYIWFLAAAAYTLAPAWQIEAIQSACGEVGVSRFSPVATSLTALRLLNTGRPH
jgi:hypothetical protein